MITTNLMSPARNASDACVGRPLDKAFFHVASARLTRAMVWYHTIPYQYDMATPYGMVPVLVLLVLPDYRTYHQTISTYVHLAVANDLATMLSSRSTDS